jgi:hypothetical protein
MVINHVWIESIVIGFVTLIIGKIIFYLFINEKDKNNKNNKNNLKINLILFITGIILHFIIEYAGFNKWYCNKECCKKLVAIS